VSADKPFRFDGFSAPNYTQVPDALFDELLPELTESELKVLLYIIRRTYGFKKDADSISLGQMVDGIRTRDGRQLDRGAGVSKASASRGVKGLEEKGIIVAVRNQSDQRGFEPTTYALRLKGDPLSQFETSHVSDLDQGLVSNLDIQETEKQQTEGQEISKGPKPARLIPKQERVILERYATDYAAELRDQAPLDSTVGRLVNLYAESNVGLSAFLDLLQEARAATQKRSAGIRTETADGSGRKAKMAYFFGVLEDLIEKRGA
jgi:DNA-binding MarR family transcriptional regulator